MSGNVSLSIAAFSAAAPGRLPTQSSGVSLSRSGVLVTAFAPDPDAEGATILRLWEQAGIAGPCTVTLPPGLTVRSVQPVDLRGRTQGQPIPVMNGACTVEITAYGPVSLRLSIP